MRFLKTISVILDILILVPGVCSGQWDVSVTSPPPCVVRGSTVDIGCSYDYPEDQSVTKKGWYKNKVLIPRGSEPHKGRFKYIGNNLHDCTLRINNIQDSDMGSYHFRFWTTRDTFASLSTSVLSGLTALTANVTPHTVSEGREVVLYCETSCEPRPTTVWFKDGQRVPEPRFNAKMEDAGGYQCAVEGQETWKSEAVMLDVQYGPQNVVLSVSPLGDVVKGSSVTLTCSSSASNPPIQSYILLKDNTEVTQNKTVTISNIQPSASGRYSCQAENNIATVTSPQVTLNVHYPPEMSSVSVNPAGEVVEGSTVTLTCSTDANPPADTYTWYKRTETPGSSSLVQVGSGQVLVLASLQLSHTGLYFCHTRNSLGENNSTEVLHVVDTIDLAAGHLVILRVGIGVKVLLAVLLLPLAVWWAWKQRLDTNTEEDAPDYVNISGSVGRRRGFISSADQDSRVVEED